MTTTNQKLTSLPSASQSKHSFDGWYTEKSGGIKITTDTVFHADTIVYAHWTVHRPAVEVPPPAAHLPMMGRIPLTTMPPSSNAPM